jgi:hypothetical protein
MTESFSQKDTIPAQFPGGIAAWTSYVMKNLNSSGVNNNKGTKGKYAVTVKFTVDKFGNISHARALNDPGNGAAQEAVRVVSESGKWKPALVNGKPIIYECKQNIIVSNTNPYITKSWDHFFKMAHFQSLKQVDKDSLRAGAMLAGSLSQIEGEFSNKKQKIVMDTSLVRKDREAQLENLSIQKGDLIKAVLTNPRYVKWEIWVAQLRKELAAHPKNKE